MGVLYGHVPRRAVVPVSQTTGRSPFPKMFHAASPSARRRIAYLPSLCPHSGHQLVSGLRRRAVNFWPRRKNDTWGWGLPGARAIVGSTLGAVPGSDSRPSGRLRRWLPGARVSGSRRKRRVRCAVFDCGIVDLAGTEVLIPCLWKAACNLTCMSLSCIVPHVGMRT